jgi:mRNA interferase RelE/StbE
MIYNLKFLPSALKEWQQLDNSIKTAFKKILAKRLENPHIASARLSSQPIECYKIKLRSIGYRLVYMVENKELVVIVLAIDRRDSIYQKLDRIISHFKDKK